jgi:hypothetical protein
LHPFGWIEKMMYLGNVVHTAEQRPEFLQIDVRAHAEQHVGIGDTTAGDEMPRSGAE